MDCTTLLKTCYLDCCGAKAPRTAKFQSQYDAYWMYLVVVTLYFFTLFMSLTQSNFVLTKITQGNSLYFLAFLGLWAYSLYTFISLRNSNPGYIAALKYEPSEEREDKSDEHSLEGQESSVRRRKKEEKPVPPQDIPIRSKWCRRCEAFIAKHDVWFSFLTCSTIVFGSVFVSVKKIIITSFVSLCCRLLSFLLHWFLR
jgi:hypothetical protein